MALAVVVVVVVVVVSSVVLVSSTAGIEKLIRILLRIGHIVVRQYIRVRNVQYFESENAGLLLLVDKGRVGEAREPRIVVEYGVIHTIVAPRPDVGRR